MKTASTFSEARDEMGGESDPEAPTRTPCPAILHSRGAPPPLKSEQVGRAMKIFAKAATTVLYQLC